MGFLGLERVDDVILSYALGKLGGRWTDPRSNSVVREILVSSVLRQDCVGLLCLL